MVIKSYVNQLYSLSGFIRLTVVTILGMAATAAPLAAATAIVLPRTGQTACYDAAGNTATCTGTGQDADLLKGAALPVPRFTDNGNGTVTDNLTSLIWMKKLNCTDTVGGIVKNVGYGDLIWNDALTWSNNLASGKCGLTDNSTAGTWRLPNVNELLSVIDLQYNSPALSTGHPFTGVDTGMSFWTSTSQKPDPTGAWGVDLDQGGTNPDLKTYAKYVWAVKGTSANVLKTGQTSCFSDTAVISCSGTSGQDGDLKKGVDETGRTITSANGTITDSLTGLVWLKDANCKDTISGINKGTFDSYYPGALPFAEALTWTKGLASGKCGLTDGSAAGSWRLPNRNELRTLLSYESGNTPTTANYGILNKAGFSNFQPSTYASSSSSALSTYMWWEAEFLTGGFVGVRGKSITEYIVPVRGGNTVATASSQAKVYLGTNDNFTVSSSGTTVYGGVGNDTVTIAAGVFGIILDQNVERINFTDASTNHKFKQTGNKINVYDAAVTTLIVSVPVQSGGTLLSFTNHTDSAALTAGVIALTQVTAPAAPSPLPNTTAKVYLGTNDNFIISSSGTTLYGGSGNDTITISAGVSAVILDQNVERINLPGASGSYSYKQTGNKINVYDTTGTTLIVTVPVQGDADGTVLGFSDGSASAKLTAGVMTVAGVAVNSAVKAAPTSMPNAPQPGLFTVAASPVNLALTLDSAQKAVSATALANSASSLTATGSDGTSFRLDIPAGALSADTVITMTPISSIANLPFSGGLRGAVKLEPEGLFFNKDVTLTIVPTIATPVDNQVFFGFSTSGEDLILATPAKPFGAAIQLSLQHFSGGGMANGTSAEKSMVLNSLASSVERRLDSEIGASMSACRQNMLRDESYVCDFSFLTAAMTEYENSVVNNRLAVAMSPSGTCADSIKAVQTLNSFERNRQLLGFAGQSAAYAKMPELTASGDAKCAAEKGNWVGTATVVRTFTSSSEVVTHTTTATFEPDPTATPSKPGFKVYKVKSGTMTTVRSPYTIIYHTLTRDLICSVSGGKTSFPLLPVDGTLEIDPVNNLYQARGYPMSDNHRVTETDSCAGTFTVSADFDWILAHDKWYSLAPNGNSFSDKFQSSAAGTNTHTWSFFKQ